MIPGSSRNWRRTSSIMSPAALPTARMAREEKTKTRMAPRKPPMKTSMSARLTTSTASSPRIRRTSSRKAEKSRKAARAAEPMA